MFKNLCLSEFHTILSVYLKDDLVFLSFFMSSAIGRSSDVQFCLYVLSVPGNDLTVHYTDNN